MHLPQTLITVMHRTGQQQTETEPNETKPYQTQARSAEEWSGVKWSPECPGCPCSESARLIQLIFAKSAYGLKGA